MHKPLTRIAASAFALIAIAAGANAHAQATIDQAKALAGDVTPSDTAGFPVTLSVPGSYKLTSNLAVPAGTTGIEVTTSGVTLDLNGFSIIAPRTCSRDNASYAVTCVGDWGLDGVSFSVAGNTLRNGRIQGFDRGVAVAGGQLENLHLKHNTLGVAGYVYDGARTLIRSVRVELSQGTGFVGSDMLIQGSTAASNGNSGFSLQRSTVLDSFAFQNKYSGFNGIDLSLGRVVASGNKGGNIVAAISLGGNLNGDVPF